MTHDVTCYDPIAEHGEIRFTVYGIAQPAGSKQSWVPTSKKTGQPFRGKGGRIIVNTVDDNPHSRTWKSEVKDAARAAYSGPPLEGPLSLEVLIYRPRLKSHYGKNGLLKPSAPVYCDVRPDATKLLRGIEDAITNAGHWRDDAQVAMQTVVKMYDATARVEIIIRRL